METQGTEVENASTEIRSEKKEWDFGRHQEALAQIGRQYPTEFLNDISDSAFDMVLEWMRENKAPEEVIDVMSNGYTLKIYIDTIRSGDEVPDISLAEVPDMILKITKMAYESGKYLQVVKERMI